MATGEEMLRQMREAGFTENEIAEWQNGQVRDMKGAGFTQEEIDKDFGLKPNLPKLEVPHPVKQEQQAAPAAAPAAPAEAPAAAPQPSTPQPSGVPAEAPPAAPEPAARPPEPDMSKVQKYVEDNFKAANDAQIKADLEAERQAAERMKKVPVPAPSVPDQSGGAAPKPAFVAPDVLVEGTKQPLTWYERLIDSASKGWGSSITGMLKRQAMPESLPEDANWAEKFTYQASSVAGDLPFMIGGAMAGGFAASEVPVLGTAVGAGIGAFAVPGMIRRSLVDNLREGKIRDVGDFAQRTMAILYDGIKQGMVGATTVATGGVAGAATRGAGPLVSGTAQTAAEIATMTTAGKALEGQLPTMDDFTIGASLVVGMHGAAITARTLPSLVKTMQDVYVKTGIRPRELAEMAKNDPTISQDLIIGGDVPDALKGHIDPEMAPKPIEIIGGQEPPLGTEPKLPTAPEVPLGKEPPEPPANGEPGSGTSSDPWASVQSHIDFEGADPKQPFSWDSLYTKLVNDLHPIFTDQKAMLKSLDKDLRDLPANRQPGLLAQNTRGTFGRAEQQLEFGTYNARTYKDNGIGLKEALAPVKDDLKGWATYAASKRAVELAERGIESGIPLADAQAVVREGAGKYEAVNKEVIAYQDRVAAMLRDSGIVSVEMYGEMRELNKNYVPFFRVMDGENGGVGIGGGLQTAQPIHAIKGSERQIVNPLESIVKNTYVYTALAERNAVAKSYLDLAQSTGHGTDWIEKVPPKVTPITLNEQEIKSLFDEFVTVRKQSQTTKSSTSTTTEGGEPVSENKIQQRNSERVKDALTSRGYTENEADIMIRRLATAGAKGGESTTTLAKEVTTTTYVPELNIRLPNDMATVFRTLRQPLEDNQIAVFNEGKREVYELKNPETAQAFKGLDSGTSNFIVKVLSVPASLLRAGATGRSPDFMIRNPIRDQITSFIYGNNIPIVDLLSGAYSLVKKDTAFQNWLKGGGANAALVSIDRDYLREKLQGMGLDTLDKETGLMSRAWNVAKTPLDVLQIISELTENMTRVGVYKRNSQGGFLGLGGKDQADLSQSDILQAANTSREASLDFAKKGSQIRALNMITDFFSANVNGLDKMVRGMKDNPTGFLTRVAIGVTLPSVLLYEANKDDKRWNDGSIPQWQKDLFYIVMTDDKIYRIPKDFQVGVIFGSGVEHLMQAFDDYNKGRSLDTQALSNYFATLWGSTVPPIVPTAVTPMLEQATNHSFFSGQKLVPDSKEKLLPEYQYNDYTTELVKKIGSIVGTFPGMRTNFMPAQAQNLASPAIIDNYIRQWTGGLGAYTVQLADLALRKAGVLDDKTTPAGTLADVPVVKAFVVRYPSAQAQAIQDFYDHEAKNQRFYDTIQQLWKDGDILALRKELGLKDNQQVDTAKMDQASALLFRMPEIKSALSTQTQLIHKITINPDIKPEEKRQLIDSVYYQMIQISHTANEAFRTVDDLLGRSVLKPPPIEVIGGQKPQTQYAPPEGGVRG